LSSADPQGRWLLAPIAPSNLDIQHVQLAITNLRAAGLISTSTPLYTVGSSQGGRFTVRVASVLGFKAISNYVSQGDGDSLMALLRVPTRFNMRANDTQAAVNNSDAQRYAAGLAARGIGSEFQLYGTAPLYPGIFTRIQGVNSTESATIYNALRQGGVVDVRGYVSIDPTTQASTWQALIPTAFRANPTFGSIGDILDSAFAEHGFFSWANQATLAFFQRFP
jgi:hypothetical protein